MNKRRASSGASRGAECDDGDRPSSRKKLKVDPAELCQQLYDIIRTFKKEDGTLLCNSLMGAPNRSQEPQYYEVFTQPTHLLKVEEKLKTDAYDYVDELSADLELLVNNAKSFYKLDSSEYKDTVDLWKLYLQNVQALERGELRTPKLSHNGSSSGRSHVAEDTLEPSNFKREEDFEEVFNANSEESAGESDEEKGDHENTPHWKFLETVTNHLKLNGNPTLQAFWKLPSRRTHPDYYERIENPMSMNQIKNKIRRGNYGTLSEVAGDMNLIFENAKRYNEPTSKLYKDAVKLQKLMQRRVQELLDIVESWSSDEESLSSPRPRDGNSNPYNPSMSSTRSQERQQTTATPASSKKKQNYKNFTGYILYSSAIRRSIVANNPDSTFGEISRIVGNEWLSLPFAAKRIWMERAARRNEETAARLADQNREFNIPMEMTYECGWDTCDYQFEDLRDCTEHCIGDGGSAGHVQQHMTSQGATDEFSCMWRDCVRVRKVKAPFPTLPRLLRHVRDLHVNRGNGKMMAVHERSRNFVAMKQNFEEL